MEGERDCNLCLQLGSSIPSSRKPPGCSSCTQHHLHRTQNAVTDSCRSSTRVQHTAFSRPTLWIVSQLMESGSFRQTYLCALLDVKSPAMVQNKEIREFAADSSSEPNEISYFWCMRLFVRVLVPWNTPRRSHQGCKTRRSHQGRRFLCCSIEEKSFLIPG